MTTRPIKMSKKEEAGGGVGGIIDRFLGWGSLESQKGMSIIFKSNVEQNGGLDARNLYRVVINTWLDAAEFCSRPIQLGCGEIGEHMYYIRTVGILDITDNYENKPCCDTNSMSFSLYPTEVDLEDAVTPSVSDSFYCYDKTVYFYDVSCMGQNKNDLTEKSSCTINSQESLDDTLYCWADEPYNPRPVGCTGNNFNAPDSAGDYTYYACVDIDGNDIFDEEVQASLTVGGCPEKCEAGIEYRDGSGDPCTYTSELECRYGCEDTYRCKYGYFCYGNECTYDGPFPGWVCDPPNWCFLPSQCISEDQADVGFVPYCQATECVEALVGPTCCGPLFLNPVIRNCYASECETDPLDSCIYSCSAMGGTCRATWEECSNLGGDCFTGYDYECDPDLPCCCDQ